MADQLDMNAAMEKLLNEIYNDYVEWSNRASQSDGDTEQRKETRARMIKEFVDGLSYTVGNKYNRVIKDGSVWGFIVNTTEDKKFNYGDILKPAGYKTPTRNAARGNVFEDYDIRWTGPNYIR